MPCRGKLLLLVNGWKQTSAGNNSIYIAHKQNNTQNHVLLSTRDFYQSLQASITHWGGWGGIKTHIWSCCPCV